MAAVDIYAGKKAVVRIINEGFGPHLFDYVLGASGGPKWFILAGLDRYTFADYFQNMCRDNTTIDEIKPIGFCK